MLHLFKLPKVKLEINQPAFRLAGAKIYGDELPIKGYWHYIFLLS